MIWNINTIPNQRGHYVIVREQPTNGLDGKITTHKYDVCYWEDGWWKNPETVIAWCGVPLPSLMDNRFVKKDR